MKTQLFVLFVCLFIYGSTTAQTNIFPATGNVGIGTISPTQLLQVNGGVSQFGGIADYTRFAADGDQTFTGLADYLVGADRYAFRYSGNQNYGLVFSATNSRYEFRDGSALPIFWISSSGNGYVKSKLAIGSTTTPTASLEITPVNGSAIKINPFATLAGNTGEIRFLELVANGANYIGFKSPDNITANKIWILPATDGTANQLLKTDGAGNLSWAVDANTTYTAGTGLLLTGTVFSNSAPDQTVVLTPGAGISITGTYPSFTISATGGGGGANTTLSNLTSPTSVNQSLLPSADNTKDLGSIAKSWKNIYSDGIIYLNGISFVRKGFLDDTFLGDNAGASIGGGQNVGVGSAVLSNNIDGSENTGVGYHALFSAANSSSNTAVGANSMYANQTGAENISIGDHALESSVNPFQNVAVGSKSLQYNSDGYQNIGIGAGSLRFNLTGDENISIGTNSLNNNTDGNANIAIGHTALFYNTTGNDNVAVGKDALTSSSYGNGNTAVGNGTLYYCTNTNYNTAIGNNALHFNSTGEENVAVGAFALNQNGAGWGNTALGFYALTSNSDGVENTAIGKNALFINSTGSSNVAIGSYALFNNQTASYNTAVGIRAMEDNTGGNSNTAFGYRALNENVLGVENTSLGYAAGDVGGFDHCTFLGSGSGSSGGFYRDNSTALGYQASVTANNQVRIGNASVTSIGGFANWSNVSDGRLKKNIHQNVPGLEFIRLLNPVTYNLDLQQLNRLNGNESIQDLSKEEIFYTGFIAQEVESAAKEVEYNFSGVDAPKNDQDLYGLRYAEFVVPLVKAVQELDSINQVLLSDLSRLKKEVTELSSIVPSAESNDGVIQINTIHLSNSEPMLGQNLPNPFGNSTLIPFRIPKNCEDASIMIIDGSYGRVISVIPVSCNETHISFESDELPAGLYTYSLLVNGEIVSTKQMILSK